MLTRDQVRRLDALAVSEYGLPSIVLMENAGRGVVDTMCSLDVDGLVVILVGPGNNGGDGFVIARHLDQLNYDVQLLTCTEPERWQGDAAINHRVAAASGIPITYLSNVAEVEAAADVWENAAWIVDAVLGTGATGAPRSPYDRLISLANEATARRLAIDIPTGLDCDSGEASDPTFEADHTCTFVSTKPGLVAEQAACYVGEVHVVDIGAPRCLVDAILAEKVTD